MTPPPPSERVTDEAEAQEGELVPGTMVGEYRIEQRIGMGGMGMVFAAVHPVIGKRVAIKVLRNEVCRDRVAVERFIDEARIVNQIAHPNIVDIFSFGELPDGRNYFAMEWLRGESLGTRSERELLTINEVCSVLAPLTRALAASHQLGIVHRDLKPDNVFLVEVPGEQMHVKLLDFGVAKLGQADQERPAHVGHTATGTIVGTPTYLSPEQAKGNEVDYRADIYALGGIAFELLTGRPPFEADNVMEMVAKHLLEAPVAPSTLAANVPTELDELIVATLAKDPAARPDLATWAAVLERVKQNREVLITQPRVAQSYTASVQFPTSALAGPTTPWPAAERASTPWPVPPPTPWPDAPRANTPWPTPPATKSSPRWTIVGIAALTVIAIAMGVLVLFSHAPRSHEASPPVTEVVPEQPRPPPVIVPTPAPPPPVLEIAPAAVPDAAPAPPDAKAKHHAHHAVAGSNTPAAEPEPPASDDDNDLLAPGTILNDAGTP